MCYESKKRNAEERGIEFLLTKKEYDFFMLLREDRTIRCAYTNQPFILQTKKVEIILLIAIIILLSLLKIIGIKKYKIGVRLFNAHLLNHKNQSHEQVSTRKLES